MKLQTLTLMEVDASYDPWNDPDDTAFPQYKAMSRVEQAVRYRLDKNNPKMMNMVLKGLNKFAYVNSAPPGGTEDEFEPLWLDRKMYFIDKADPAGQKLIKLMKQVKKDEDYLRDIPTHKARKAKAAAGDYLRIKQTEPGSVVDPSEIYENIRVYQREEDRFKWLHNPVKFGDDPKYAGSPNHYDWKGASATTYFLVAHWLEENGTPFQKVFAAMDDGQPWAVAVAANHALVLHIHESTATVYVRGQDPINAKKFLQQPPGVLIAIKNTLEVALQELDKHGVKL